MTKLDKRFQYYMNVPDQVNDGSDKISEVNDHTASELFEESMGLYDTITESNHIKVIVQVIEKSKGGEVMEPRWHLQGYIEHDYSKDQNAKDLVYDYAKSKGLNPKEKETMCTRKQLSKDRKGNLIYILKDQKDLDYVLFKGISKEELEECLCQWKDMKGTKVTKGAKEKKLTWFEEVYRELSKECVTKDIKGEWRIDYIKVYQIIRRKGTKVGKKLNWNIERDLTNALANQLEIDYPSERNKRVNNYMIKCAKDDPNFSEIFFIKS